ncbi:MAG: hypothetical protein GKR90_17580 [Pseudomonadales bacterium]|nr:hypothetical protein [Pseudomonadales bacterium]
MKLSEGAHVAEILSGIAVVVSLVILILEVQENTETQKLAAAQQVLGLSATNNTILTADESLSDLMSIAWSGEKELSPSQDARFNSLLLSIFAAHWQVHYQYEKGFLDRDIFDAYDRRNRQIVSSPRVQEWWRSNKFRFSESYQDYVNRLLPADA